MALSKSYSLIWESESIHLSFDCIATLNILPKGSKDRAYSTLDVVLSRTFSKKAEFDPASGLKAANVRLSIQGILGTDVVIIPPELPAHNFLAETLGAAIQAAGPKEHTVATTKLLLPEDDGFVVRCDFLECRMRGFEYALETKSFLAPREEVRRAKASGLDSAASFVSLLQQSLGAMSLKADCEAGAKVLRIAENELQNRISFPWLSKEPIPAKRLVWVEGRPDFEFSRRMYEAAWALGITLVVIDNPGHWFQDDQAPFAYLREAFIPINISVDEGFVGRIVNAVKNYDKPIDGIISVSDARVIGVAQACEILGFPTSPSNAYIVAADKYKTRLMEDDNGSSFKVNGVEDLKAQLSLRSDHHLDFPLIVKPCLGWGSECISRVSNKTELIRAVEKASARHATSPQRRTDVIIEPFIDGPEVDANFVLLDGEILFHEIADDFPSPGDAVNASWEDNFQETANLLPSGLCQEELVVIRDSIHQSILRQGFRSGTFHCEGRVRFSNLHYETREGREDLYPNAPRSSPKRKPEFYLHEINARPSGYLESVATHLTYGIDYYALQILYSLDEISRYRTLSLPFLNGPQWWLVLLIIPETRAGTMKTDDPAKELLQRDQLLADAVPDYKTVQKKGGILGGPRASALSYLAYFSVVSRTGRLDALGLADRIRNGYEYKLEEDEHAECKESLIVRKESTAFKV